MSYDERPLGIFDPAFEGEPEHDWAYLDELERTGYPPQHNRLSYQPQILIDNMPGRRQHAVCCAHIPDRQQCFVLLCTSLLLALL